MPKGSVKKNARSSAVDKLIYELRSGKVTHSGEYNPEKKAQILHNGPQKHSYPVKKEVEKMVDYEHLAPPKLYPNQVKLGIDEGEERFPKESKVPNVKKYDENGNYVKYKRPIKKDNAPNLSTNEVIRKNLLSNPVAQRHNKKPKTGA